MELDEFISQYENTDPIWWQTQGDYKQRLMFEEAVRRMEKAEAALRNLQIAARAATGAMQVYQDLLDEKAYVSTRGTIVYTKNGAL